jgi:hypothetical protein
MKRKIIYLSLFCLAIQAVCFAKLPQNPRSEVALTIYNANFGVVRESRGMFFEKGINTVKFTDVASAIDPTTVNFRCLSAPGGVSILEQNYEYDLVSTASLLKRYIDKKVTVVLKGSGADVSKEITGVLLTASESGYAPSAGDIIIKTDTNGIELIDKGSVEEISLTELPGDLVTRPTLVWLADAKEKGDQLCQVAYTTEQINWRADYSALLSPDETAIDFTGWVTIDNKSGATYKDATLKLMAGDVRRVMEPRPMMARAEMAVGGAEVEEGFEEKPFMEYHLYTLRRKSTINNNQIKQIEFIAPALGVPVKKLYIYERGQQMIYRQDQQADKVKIKIEFQNTPENKLGIALPKGRVRVFKKDPADESLEFVGEDQIDHTAKKEKVSLYIGNAFDVVAEHTLLDSKVGRRQRIETHKIELRNRKDQAVTVFVDEKFPPHVNWTIEPTTHKYEKRDANTARFEVNIAADSTQTLQFTATQTW